MANNLAIAKKIFSDVEISLSPGSIGPGWYQLMRWLLAILLWSDAVVVVVSDDCILKLCLII